MFVQSLTCDKFAIFLIMLKSGKKSLNFHPSRYPSIMTNQETSLPTTLAVQISSNKMFSSDKLLMLTSTLPFGHPIVVHLSKDVSNNQVKETDQVPDLD